MRNVTSCKIRSVRTAFLLFDSHSDFRSLRNPNRGPLRYNCVYPLLTHVFARLSYRTGIRCLKPDCLPLWQLRWKKRKLSEYWGERVARRYIETQESRRNQDVFTQGLQRLHAVVAMKGSYLWTRSKASLSATPACSI